MMLSACGGTTTATPADAPTSTPTAEPTPTPAPTPYPDATEGLEYTLNEDGESYSLTGFGTVTDMKIVVAAEYKGLPVTEIGAHAFEESEIESIIMPDSVKVINEFAFSRALKLSHVRLPAFIEIIGNQSLMAAPIEGELVLPDTVTYLGNGAFHGAMFTKITLGLGLTKIRDNAFSLCTELEEVMIPEGATYKIAAKMFRGCPKLTEFYIPEGITEIEESAFIDCTGLKTISIPQSVTKIGDNAFKGCTVIEEILLPESVSRLGQSVFSGCTMLKSVNIPKKVKTVMPKTFIECPALVSINYGGTKDEWSNVRLMNGWIEEDKTVEIKYSAE